MSDSDEIGAIFPVRRDLLRSLDAREVLELPLPKLRSMDPPLETTPDASWCKLEATGRLAVWSTFTNEVSAWYLSRETQAALLRSKGVPMAYEKWPGYENANAMWLVGGYGPVLFTVCTYKLCVPAIDIFCQLEGNSVHMRHGEYIPPKTDRHAKHPQWVAQCTLNGKPKTPVVFGELKYQGDVDLVTLISASEHGVSREQSEILEFMADYLHAHNVQYGFITTWQHTVFLKLASLPDEPSSNSSAPTPKLLFSPPIARSAPTVVEGTENPTIGVMLGLVYLLFQATGTKPT